MKVFRYNRNLTMLTVIIIFSAILISVAFLLPRTVSEFKADIDGDGVIDTLQVRKQGIGRFGDRLVIETQGATQIYDLSRLKPWKVQAADVDGDGNIEISVGVYKATRFDDELKKRPFLYNWDADGISPKWLGSSLARPFDDYIFTDVNGDGMDNLISIERLPGSGKVVNSYRWKGFGWIGIGQSMEFDDISHLKTGEQISGNRRPIYARVKTSGIWQWVTLHYQQEKFILEDE